MKRMIAMTAAVLLAALDWAALHDIAAREPDATAEMGDAGGERRGIRVPGMGMAPPAPAGGMTVTIT